MASQWNQRTRYNFPPSLDPVHQYYGKNGAVTDRRFVPRSLGTSPSVPPVNPNAGPRKSCQILLATIAVLTIFLILIIIYTSLIFALIPSEGGSVQATALIPSEGGFVQATALTPSEGGSVQSTALTPAKGGPVQPTALPPGEGGPVQSTAEWNSWSPWTTCTVTCNGGVRYRTRQCLDTDSTMASTNCVGTSQESDICNIQQCRPTWGDWNAYGQCSSTCGNGQETRTRICDVAGTTGAECDGPTPVETRLCNSGQCPIWGVWGDYSSCSLTCGAGMQIRTRECSDPDSTGGRCEGEAPSSSQECNDEPCRTSVAVSSAITLDMEFTDDLSDSTSQLYRQLKMDVEEQVSTVLRGEFGESLQSVEVIGFRPGSGSVIADIRVIIMSNGEMGQLDVATQQVEDAIQAAATNGKFGSLPVTGVEAQPQQDEEAPVISEIPNQNVNTDTGLPTAKVSWSQPTALDNSGDDVTLTSVHNPGDLFPIGTTTVTYVAVDSSGNEATLQFDIIVTDMEPPVIAGNPGNQDVSTSSCTGSANTVVSWTPPTATDNSEREVTLSSNNEPGATFPIGSTDVIYTADDGNGNTATSQFTVTVVDSSPSCNEQLSGTVACPLTIRAYLNVGVDSGVMLQPGDDWDAPFQNGVLAVTLSKSAKITRVLVTNADVDVNFWVFYHVVGTPETITRFVADGDGNLIEFVGSTDPTMPTQLPDLTDPIDRLEIHVVDGDVLVTTAFFGCYL